MKLTAMKNYDFMLVNTANVLFKKPPKSLKIF